MTSTILVYRHHGHVLILWTYKEAEIQFQILGVFWSDCVGLNFQRKCFVPNNLKYSVWKAASARMRSAT